MTEVQGWNDWLKSLPQEADEYLLQICRNLISFSGVKNKQRILDIGTGRGRLAFEMFNYTKGKCSVTGIDAEKECIDFCLATKEELELDDKDNINFVCADLEKLPFPDKTFDVVVSRSVIMHTLNKDKVLRELSRVLKDNGRIVMFEGLHYDKTFRIYPMLDKKLLNYEKFKEIEEKVRNDKDDPITNFDFETLKNIIKLSGFDYSKKTNYKSFGGNILIKQFPITYQNIFYDKKISLPRKYSFQEKMLKYLSEDEYLEYQETVKNALSLKIGFLVNDYAYITAQKNSKLLQRIEISMKMTTAYIKDFQFLKNNYFINRVFNRWFCKKESIKNLIRVFKNKPKKELIRLIIEIVIKIR